MTAAMLLLGVVGESLAHAAIRLWRWQPAHFWAIAACGVAGFLVLVLEGPR